MTRFFLIRHALIDGYGTHLAGRAAGVRLNARGREQAAALAHRFAAAPLAAVYSSPLERALETAGPIAAATGREVIACDDFLEIDFGAWTGAALSELVDDPHFRRFNTFRSATCIPDGEYMLQAQLRIVTGINRLRSEHPDRQVAIVSHSDMIKAAIAYYAGIPLDLCQRLEISPASVSVVDIDEESVRIIGLNDTQATGDVP